MRNERWTSTILNEQDADFPLRVCPGCEEEFRRGWPGDTDNECERCYLAPMAGEFYEEERAEMERRGCWPVEFIGC